MLMRGIVQQWRRSVKLLECEEVFNMLIDCTDGKEPVVTIRVSSWPLEDRVFKFSDYDHARATFEELRSNCRKGTTIIFISEVINDD